MAKILTLNETIEIESVDNKDLIGYGFASAAEPGRDPDEADMVIRWFLMTRDTSRWPPNNRVTLKVPDDETWRVTTKAAFVARVRANFNSASTYYVKANCARTLNDAGPPATIARPIVVPPFLEPDPESESQTDVGVCPIFAPDDTVLGYVLTRFQDTGHSLEHWALLPGYSEPSAEAPVDLGKRVGENATADFPFLLDSVSWSADATFYTCACTYYHDMSVIDAGDE